jgi:hypothetical protein
MSTESVSSDSSLQAAQLIEDQLSEEELEMVAGGVLNERHHSSKKDTQAVGGNPPIASSNGVSHSSPAGYESKPDIYDTLTLTS